MKRSSIVTVESFSRTTGIHITTKHTGKMEGLTIMTPGRAV